MRIILSIITSLILIVSCSKRESINDSIFINNTAELKSNDNGKFTAWVTLKNNNQVGAYIKQNDKLYCGSSSSNPMENVDPYTFEVLSDSGYAKDSRHVYYPISLLCVDSADYGYCYCDEYVLEGALSAKFKYLGKDYATDGQKVFFRGKLIPEAVGNTTQLVEGPIFLFSIKDQNNVFIYKSKLEMADPDSFHYWKTVGYNTYLLKDKKHIWEFAPPNFPKIIK
jgi:hypothetical protein